MQLQDTLAAVRKFHEVMGAPVAARPTLLPGDGAEAVRIAGLIAAQAKQIMVQAHPAGDVLLSRAAMALEEFAEWLQAHACGDLLAAADAWTDRAYVLLGDAVAAGLPAVELFAEVHRSNMTKKPDPSQIGKAIKGLEYQPPDLQKILGIATRPDVQP